MILNRWLAAELGYVLSCASISATQRHCFALPCVPSATQLAIPWHPYQRYIVSLHYPCQLIISHLTCYAMTSWHTEICKLVPVRLWFESSYSELTYYPVSIDSCTCRFGVTSYSRQNASIREIPKGEIRRGSTSRQGPRLTQDSELESAMRSAVPVRASNWDVMTRLGAPPGSVRRATQ